MGFSASAAKPIEKPVVHAAALGSDVLAIDGKGVIRAIWRKVKVPGHAAEVLKFVTSL